MNPIHHDPEFAQQAGYPGPFAVGMRQAAVLASAVALWLGDEAVRRFRVQFREQAWPGDVLTYTGRVVATKAIGDELLVELELQVTRPAGGQHIVGWASCALPAHSVS
jgi:acyl dehydratase